jgi:DNA-binding response OmpR family regulator
VPRILVIDDQPHVRAGVLIALRARGFEAVGAEDAKSALREFEARPFDLALVDIYMPGTDGVTLIKSLRALAPSLPIIAMSGVLLNDSERTALDFLPKAPGLTDIVCLQKPFRPRDLMQAIRSAVGLAGAPAA